MAAYMITFIFVLIASCIHQLNADPRTDIVARWCRETFVKNSDSYISLYQNTTDLMENDMFTNKFSYKMQGEPGNKMHVFAQCMNDLTSEECRTCFSHVSDLLYSCLPSTGGRVYLDGCFMRFENFSFLQSGVTSDDIKRCSTTTENSAKHNDTVKDVITKLKQKAQLNKGFAELQDTLNGVSVYGMAICWKTLQPDLCPFCLKFAVETALECLPSSEGRVLNWGCYLRYSDYEFANNPKLRQLEVTLLSNVAYFLGAVAICSLAIWTGFFIGKIAFKRRQKRQHKAIGNNVESSVYNKSLPSMQFKYSTLEKATETFSLDHRLGQGGFGEVFKGTLPDGREIAIKRLYTSGKFQIQDVHNEMDVINRAKHKNLVIFLGCCFSNRDSYLVYEFLANKSLNCILFDSEKKKELDWKKRLGIIMGTAEGLEYLHKHCQVRIIHRDIKASNILLDLRYKPKIADFGLARFNSCDQTLMGTAIAGTLGYMAPEYLAQGRLTEKVDVYSYGVLVLEIVSGVQSTKFQSEDTFETVVTTAWKHFQSKTVSEIVDKSLAIEDENTEEIAKIVQVGLLCTQESPLLRPTMTQVIQMLQNKDADLPIPTKPPFTEESMEPCKSLSSSLRKTCFTSDSKELI